MNAEQKTNYFKELTLNLQRGGFTVGLELDGILPVELDGQRLCQITDSGGVRYWKEDVASDKLEAALDKATDIAKVTAEYMRLVEAAPRLTVGSLKGDYRTLAEFNDTVLVGHPTSLGMQFISWELTNNRSSLYQGHYLGPGAGVGSYTAAKQDFAVRSGLIPKKALFTPEQMMEIYYCCTDVLAGLYSITDEQQECLKSILEQIEHGVPDFDERLQKELNASDAPDSDGMRFC
ncbi:hypothetical protein D1646_03800 [Pseudoflavonifractor sp. 60]|nr:hypothetical protein [Pseudoflavonifractor sp. 60]